MGELPKKRSETVFEDFKQAYNPHQALVEANRCLYCVEAPCINACPTAIDIPQFIRKISTENLRGSARTIFDANILGMSCARVCPVEELCVGKCVFNDMEQAPIQIGKLQRYATDHAYAQGWRFFEAGADTGKSVGIVGAGPAALAAAHELRRLGHACTMYEKRPVIGGLNATGVAPYKMRADAGIQEANWVLEIGGIEVKQAQVGTSTTWSELEQRHDALLVAFGLGPDRYLDIPGSDLAGVHGAVDFIERFKLGEVDLTGVETAVVVGGGNTALDAVRELKGLGVAEVVLAYRGPEAGMSGYKHEWHAARVEGVRSGWSRLPVAYQGSDGKLERVRWVRLDADKKVIAGSEFDSAAQLVLVAIGQNKLGALVEQLEGVEVERGCIVASHGATGRPGVFAAGDCANGGTEVVYAAAEGKHAAHSIDTYLATKGT